MAFKRSFLAYAAYIGAWLLAAALAVVLALASPNEPQWVGEVPAANQSEGTLAAVHAHRVPPMPLPTSRRSA